MANELQYYGDPSADSGLTIVARVYDDTGTQTGSDVSCTEVGSLAIYRGDMPTAGAGEYAVRFFDGTTLKSQGVIYWDGAAEVNQSTINTDIDALNDFDPASDTVARVTLVDTTTANTDMRGTDNALLASSYTTPPTTTEIEAALINEGDGQQLIDAILQVINSSLDLPALELTAIGQAVRSELTTELGRIDATVSSRSTLTAAQVNSEVDTALSDYDAPTKAELDAAQSSIETKMDDDIIPNTNLIPATV